MRKAILRRQGLAPLLCAGLLAGCMSGPNYRAPASAAASAVVGPFVSQTQGADPTAALPADWWRLYDDPALDRIISEALDANTDLRAANANLLRARAVLSEARAGRYPTTTTSGGATWGRGATSLGGGYDADSKRRRWSEQAEVNASWEVDLFGRVSRVIEAAHADTDAVAAARDAVRVWVVSEATRAYSQACALGDSIEVAHASLSLTESSYQIVAAQQQAGSGSTLDLERASAAVANARAAIPPLEGRRKAALFELAALMGRAPSDIPASASACVRPPTLRRPIPIGDGAALLRRRPDIRQAERTLAADTARTGVAVADLYPRISLGGAFAYQHGGAGRAGPATSFSLGPLITWSFPNILVARARIRQARATADADLARFDGVVLTSLKETEQALTSYAAALDEQTALTEARDRSERAFRLADLRYRAGSISYLDQILAQASLTDARAKLAAANLRVSSDRVDVFKALGGGWEDTPVAGEPAPGDARPRP